MVFTRLSFFGTGRAFMPLFVLSVGAEMWHFRAGINVIHCLGSEMFFMGKRLQQYLIWFERLKFLIFNIRF